MLTLRPKTGTLTPLSSASAGTRDDGDPGPDGPARGPVTTCSRRRQLPRQARCLACGPTLTRRHMAAVGAGQLQAPGQPSATDQLSAYRRLRRAAERRQRPDRAAARAGSGLRLVPALRRHRRPVIAFVAFALASVTDLLDGELARRRSLITDFGKIADPIADKALTGSALITLSYLGELPWWVTAIIVVREVAVTGLRFWVIRRGVIAASRGGKAKTMLQVIAISLYVLPVHLGPTRALVMGAALVVTVLTGIDYTARAIRLRRAVQ